jgi:hypothetical protein
VMVSSYKITSLHVIALLRIFKQELAGWGFTYRDSPTKSSLRRNAYILSSYRLMALQKDGLAERFQ